MINVLGPPECLPCIGQQRYNDQSGSSLLKGSWISQVLVDKSENALAAQHYRDDGDGRQLAFESLVTLGTVGNTRHEKHHTDEDSTSSGLNLRSILACPSIGNGVS